MTKPSTKAVSAHPAADTSANENADPLAESPDPRRLHEATDRLNDVLLDFENALSKLNLGVSASVTLHEDDHGWMTVLSFSKMHGGFKLFVQSGLDGDPDSWNVTPITSASRETRLQAVEYLPKLYENLLAAFEAEITRVNESIVQVEGLTQAIRATAAKR